MVRSFIGGTLPLAGPSMYAKLTPQWAGTLLGLVQVALIPIPFVFYKWGERIRNKSRLITRMREDQERSEKRAARAKARQERRNGNGEVVVNNEVNGRDVEKGALGKETTEAVGTEKNMHTPEALAKIPTIN